MSAEPKRLVLLRHGRTAWNAEGRAQGHADVELDDVGHAQAAAVAPWVAALRPALLRSSDLARARQTAAYVEKETGLTAVLDRRLREFDVGSRSGLTVPEFAERLPDEYAAWAEGRHGDVPSAETPEQVAARAVPACRELLGSVAPGQTAVVVGHGACIRVVVAALLDWEPRVAESLRGLDNCAAAILEERGGRAIRLVAWNTGPDFVSRPAVG